MPGASFGGGLRGGGQPAPVAAQHGTVVGDNRLPEPPC